MNVPFILRRWWAIAMCCLMPLFTQALDTDSTRLASANATYKEQPTKHFFFIPVTDDTISFDESFAAFTSAVQEHLHGITSISIKFNYAVSHEELMSSISKDVMVKLAETSVPSTIISISANLQEVETPYISIVLVVQPNS